MLFGVAAGKFHSFCVHGLAYTISINIMQLFNFQVIVAFDIDIMWLCEILQPEVNFIWLNRLQPELDRLSKYNSFGNKLWSILITASWI